MEVVFKLTPDQRKIADGMFLNSQEEEDRVRAHVVATAVENDEINLYDPTDFWAGNVLGYMSDHPARNKRQHLEYNEDSGTLTYKGDRYPMVQDGAMEKIERISDGGILNLRVVKYETSDRRLRWYETMGSFVYGRGTILDLIAYAKDQKKKTGLAPAFPARFPEHSACVKMIAGGATYNKINASFDAKVVKEVKAFLG